MKVAVLDFLGIELAQATGRIVGKLKTGFIRVPEYLSDKIREGYGIKNE
jgi:hypothetical protein